MRDDIKIGYIVDVPAGADEVCTTRYRLRVAEISEYGLTGPRVRADLTPMPGRSIVSNGYLIRTVPWDIAEKATIIEHQVLCDRCRATAPTGMCCSSHNRELCHRCYRFTHFVEICRRSWSRRGGCEKCAAEGLDPTTKVTPAPSWVKPAQPKAAAKPAKPAKPKAVRLSRAQVELLTDVATHPQYYVRTFGRWGRTADCLKRLGLVTTRWCEGGQTEVVVTDDGRTEAIRRGIIAAVKPEEEVPARG